MNTGVKIGIGFLAGAGIGGAIGAFATKIVLDRRYNAEIAEIREAFRKDRKQKAKAEKGAKSGSESVVEVPEKPKQDDILPGGIKKREIKDEDRVPYTKFYDENNTVEEGVIPEFKETTREDRINNIQLISLDEYYADRENFKVELTYYKHSNVLVDDLHEQVIDDGDWVTTCGDFFVDHFGYEEEEPDCVFVRNNNTSTDYCIYLEDDVEADPYFSESANSLEEGD